MHVGEFAEDAAADSLPTLIVETPPEVETPGGLSTESIGVATTVTVPAEPVAPQAEDPPSYFCENCKGKVAQGDPECSTCEETLNWSGLT